MSIPSEIFNREYFMQDNVCRFCWSNSAFIPLDLNNTQIDSKENESNLPYKIRKCLDIDICLTNIPNKICEKCYKKVVGFYDFKKFCQESDQKLREIIKEPQFEIGIRVEKFEIDLDSNQNENSSDPIEGSNDVLSENNKSIVRKYTRKKRTPTYCNICCLELHTMIELKKHKEEYHGIENGFYKCFGCEKKFRNFKLRLGHEINFCKGLKNGYKCEICENYLPTRRKFEHHRRDHRNNIIKDVPEDIFKCIHCSKLFKNRDDLKEHLTEHVKKQYVCETCGRIFSRQDYLSKHMHTHTGVKQYACTYCEFRANQKSALTIHIRKHTGERPFRCDICPLSCTSSSNLRVHKKRHLGQKLFECHACEKKFGYKTSLEEHIASAHVQAYNHVCECGAAFTRPGALRRHRQTKHEEKVLEKVNE